MSNRTVYSRRGFVATLTAGVSALAAASVGSSRVSAQSKTLNLYSARHYETDNALYTGFTEKTGVRINLVESKADELIERIKSEGVNSPADVVLTVDAGRLWRAQEAGILAPVKSTLLEAAVPESLRDPEGLWFGLTRRARVLVYNKEKVDPAELSGYEALAESQWKSRILVRSSTNVYNQSLTGALMEVHGTPDTEKWAKGLVANFARSPEGGDTDQIKAVAAGIGDVAISNHYYLARLISSDKAEDKAVAEKVGLFFPNQSDRGTHVNISGGGVVKTAPHPEEAQQFLEYLISPEAQAIFAKGNYEYPVLSSAEVDPIVKAFGEFKPDSVSAAVFGRNNAEALKLMDRAGWA